MSTKKQKRSLDFKDRKKKKSTRIAYLVAILGGVFIVLVIFFVILFNALFPPVDTEAMKRKERFPAEIYFSDAQERFLVAEKRYIIKESDPADQAAEVVRALLEGSKTGHLNTFPDGVALLGVAVDKDGVASVNFSAELLKNHPRGSTAEMATLYSLVNSLAQNIPQIRSVRILVDGKAVNSIGGHISTLGPIESNPELLAGAQPKSN